jgi:hydroxymethylpyrimidine/phosphomethylpyrimidine kinase
MNASSTPVPPLVLVFAASDPCCGAGIQADILALASLGCHPLTVVTALTVQDTVGVESLHAVDSDLVEQQARALLEDMPVAAFKIGMLGSVENVVAVAEIVSDYPDVPVVFDPVLASGRGDEFANEEILAAMCELLLPQTTVLTPNSVEARRLAADPEDEEGEEGEDESPDILGAADGPARAGSVVGRSGVLPSDELARCAGSLIGMGCQYVLITGTHEQTVQVTNSLYGEAGLIRRDSWERLSGSYHGSGCTLASAVAAMLAAGADIEGAVREAQEYTWQTLAQGFRPGMGQFIPDRLFWARPPVGGDDALEDEDADEGGAADDATGGGDEPHA